MQGAEGTGRCGVKRDGYGDVSDGRTKESGRGASAAGAELAGGRWRGGGGAANPSSALAMQKLEPARTCEQERVRKGEGDGKRHGVNRRRMLKPGAAVGVGGGRHKGKPGPGRGGLMWRTSKRH